MTPLLTCFVPSMATGAPFTISLHSWVPPAHVGLLAAPGLGKRALWQIKITVDGVNVS